MLLLPIKMTVDIVYGDDGDADVADNDDHDDYDDDKQ